MRHSRPMRQKPRALASVLAGMLVLAACSAEGTSPSTQARGSDAPPGASSSQAATSPSSEPSPGAPASDHPAASTDQQVAATDLEQLLPDEISGQPVKKGSMAGDRFLTSGLSTPDLEGVLSRLGVRPRDISVSFAYTAPGPSGTGVFAFEVQGASEQDLLRALTDGRQPETRGSIAGNPKVLGGKPTVTIADETMPGGNSVYRYAAGSFVFFITAGHESTAGEILTSLP